ncbi:hypothetical protein [Streptomyces sp. 1331.2]|uniref:hypothetical protein n=1 Tax=Streptomyces sp. 1331.2 TaxID=1938835 RepID=UPI000BD96583|nr:hypothetical protein [Streptomyces sp. 1331.2]SOB78761.1 hypothetical protein SAMN06272789_0073 [Streptomyces sp. 1331.2]
MLRFHGAWRITVVGRSADFDQRAVVRSPYGARVLPGREGAVLDVDEESWTLSLEHHLWGRSWQPNLRTTPGPLTERDGVRSQLLTSNDCHWPGKPLDYVNFVLRLDQAIAPATVPGRTARAAGAAGVPIAAPVQAVRTSSSHTTAPGHTTVPGHTAVPGRTAAPVSERGQTLRAPW